MTAYKLISYTVNGHSSAINDALSKGHITQAIYLNTSVINYIESNYKLGYISDDAYKYFYRRLYLLSGQNLEIALINVDMSNLDNELIN